MQNIKVVSIGSGLLSSPLTASVNTASRTVSVAIDPANGPWTFEALAPVQQNPAVLQYGGFTLTYDGQLNSSPITIQIVDVSSEPLKDLLAQAYGLGLAPLGPVAQLASDASSLTGVASLQASYTDAPPAGSPAPRLYMLAPGSPPQALSGQFSLYQQTRVSAYVSRLNSRFGVAQQSV